VDDRTSQPSAVAGLCSAVTTSVPEPANWKDGLPTELPVRLGRYNLLQLLGKGGMGAVYLARDTQLERQVALKLPRFTPKDVPEILERFQREARAAAKLHHPGICAAYDVGQVNGVHYLTMAYIEGKPLRELTKDGKPVPPRRAAAIVQQIAIAMQHAHDRGIIHRDLKPHNILLSEQDEPVVMDFGLARRITGPSEVRLTASGILLGTPAYMAPEQIDDGPQKFGPSSDIYTLGVILYEMLTGRLPFAGPLATMLAQIMFDPPPPPREFQADLDPAMVALCLKALGKRPQDRYPSMRDFANALGDYLARTPPPATPPSARPDDPTHRITAGPPTAELPDTLVHGSRPTAAAPRRGAGWLLAVAVGAPLLILAVLAGFVLLQRQGKENPPPPTGNKDKAAPDNPAPAPKPAAEAPAKAAAVTLARGEFHWPAESLRQGRVPAPDLRAAKKLFTEDFADPQKKWLVSRGEKMEGGFKDGKYFMHATGRGVWRANVGHAPLEDFACLVVGRIRSAHANAAWGLIISRAEAKESVLRIRLSWDGEFGVVKFNPEAEPRATPLAGPLRHPAIKPDEAFNALLVIFRNRLLEAYVNGVAVCDPIPLAENDYTPARVGLGLYGGQEESTAEFQQITIWSAANVPPPEARPAGK
jgi:predicted Ser/Thr protein kinase